MTADQKIEALTPNERDLLRRITAGASYKEIARDTFRSVSTIKCTAYKIFDKLGVPENTSRRTIAATRFQVWLNRQ